MDDELTALLGLGLGLDDDVGVCFYLPTRDYEYVYFVGNLLAHRK